MIRIRLENKEVVLSLKELQKLLWRRKLDDTTEVFHPFDKEWVYARDLMADYGKEPAAFNKLEKLQDEPIVVKAEIPTEVSKSVKAAKSAEQKTVQVPVQLRTTARQPDGRVERSVERAPHPRHRQPTYENNPPMTPELQPRRVGHRVPREDSKPTSAAGLQFWQRSGVILVALIFFAPLGIVLLWMRPNVGMLGNVLVKIILTAFFAYVWISGLLEGENYAAVSEIIRQVSRSFLG